MTSILFLHGQPGSGAEWSAVSALLGAEFHPTAPDRPGWGADAGPALGVGETAAWIEGLLAGGHGRSILVAHSWAGAPAVVAAAARPDLVDGLVLVSAAAGRAALGRIDRVLALPVLGEALAVPMLVAAGRLTGRRLAPGVRALLSGVGLAPLDRLPRSWRTRRGAWRSFAVEQRALVGEIEDVEAALPRVSAPTAVLYGDRDRIVLPSASRALAAGIPGAEATAVAGAGHLLHVGVPDAVARAIRETAERVRRG